jgi:flagellar motor switch protein FliN/FliY
MDKDNKDPLQEPGYQVAEFAPLRPEAAATGGAKPDRINHLLKVDVEAQVSLGTVSLKLSDVMGLEPGAVVTLDREVGQPVDLIVNNQVYARGVVVVVDGRYGLRITQLVGE